MRFLTTNLLSGSPGYMTGKKNNKEKWEIINIGYFIGTKKGESKRGKRHRRMSGNKEMKSQGVPEEGNEAILRNK